MHENSFSTIGPEHMRTASPGVEMKNTLARSERGKQIVISKKRFN